MSAGDSCIGEWDPALGIWVGEKAAAFCTNEFPHPLYIFGYGSLIWRPGPLLEGLSSFHCKAYGNRRIFAQRSCDHRGTVDFPGIVLNLVSDDMLRQKGYQMDESLDTYCEGLIWYVPSDKVEEVISDLDFREKGGYSRNFITVLLQDTTPFHDKGTTVQALVYTGREDNPNFFLPSRFSQIVPSDEHVGHCAVGGRFGFMRRNLVVDLIAAAVGPSGPNIEYLFRLVHFLEERGIIDEYLRDLSNAVRLRIGPARYRSMFNQRVPEKPHKGMKRNHLLGWGSNEFCQLSCSSKEAILPSPIALLDYEEEHEMRWEEASHHHLLAGGASSAYVAYDQIHLWGKVCSQVLEQLLPQHMREEIVEKQDVVIQGIVGAALGQDHSLFILSSGLVFGVGDNDHGQLFLDHEISVKVADLILSPLPDRPGHFTVQHKIAVENKTAYVIDSDLHLYRPIKRRIVKVAVGLHHSTTLTACGSVYVWGRVKRGDGSATGLLWRPESRAKIIDIACGARYTVAVDELGKAYTMGQNKFHCLGRQLLSSAEYDANFALVPLPEDVRVQRVACGWSHTVVRGIKKSGELVYFAWGRRDMSQYPVEGSIEGPAVLHGLPDGSEIVEVWCGSEFTVVADALGRLWGCGWNEHSNLGPTSHGDNNSACFHVWHLIGNSLCGKDNHELRLLHIWEGAVSCGGGHVICLASYK